MLKVSGAQTALRGRDRFFRAVDEFRQAAPGVWAAGRSDVRQIYEGRLTGTPIHRVLAIDTRMESGDFEARRQAAYASDALLML